MYYDSQLSIVAVGYSGDGSNSAAFALAGLTSYGELDINFGQDGLVTTSFPNSILSMANAAVLERTCDKPCKIVVAGTVAFAGSSNDFALARYELDGNLDESFGDNGLVSTAFSAFSTDIVNAVDLQENGDIVAAGVFW